MAGSARNPLAATRPPVSDSRRRVSRTSHGTGNSGRIPALPEQTSEKRKKVTVVDGVRRLTGIARPDKLLRTEEDVFCDAATMLLEADFLLIAAGAGFSADSGLPVYKVKSHRQIFWLPVLPAFDLSNVYFGKVCILTDVNARRRTLRM
jgi:hypothetical protein